MQVAERARWIWATPTILALSWLVLLFAGCKDETIHDDLPATDLVLLPSAPKVIIFMIDGSRQSETFDDPTHQFVPQMWNQLRPLGTTSENFRNVGDTRTIPGHAAVLTGTWQTIANDGTQRPDQPTLFEYYRSQTGAPASDTVIIGGKSKLAALSYSTHASYGAAFGATVDVGHPSDEAVFDQLIATLQATQPRLVLVALSEVDLKGHSNVWQDYLDQILIADSLCAATWDFVQSDPYYAGQTYLFVTNDHGRHDDSHGGFSNHGDACEGCQKLLFLALGPTIKQNHVVPATSAYTQRDLCSTIAEVMGIAVPFADGTTMDEILEPTTTGIHD